VLGAFKTIRANEKRDTWAAFFLLFGLLTSHSILETARDALFLSKIPAEKLPWVYIGIAIVSLLITQLQLRLGRAMNRRTALSIWTAAAAFVTLLFWIALDVFGSIGLYALYVWSGVLTTLVLIHFWTLLGSLFSIAQAKRLYGVVGTGSVAGAIFGSAAASGLGLLLPARHLLLVSAVGFAITALIPRAMRDVQGIETSKDGEKDGFLASARFVFRQPYARRLAAFVIVSTAGLTVADYVFKSVVAREIPKPELAAFFGTTYLVLNSLSLLTQLGLVRYIFRRFHLGTALAILPALLVAGGAGAVVFAGLGSALAIKGADGAFKHSLHRTATELLFVPVSDRSRALVKAFVDVIGQRGGQTIASLAVLGFAAFEAPPQLVAGFLMVICGFWLIGALDLRRHYVDLVRVSVERGLGTEGFPDLDVASLERLYAALDSNNDAEVVAALEVLEREGRARVVPVLILHHPSHEVVVRALSLFTREGRANAVRTIDRLLDHSSWEVRAAAIAARSVIEPDEKLLRLRLSLEESPEVRAAIMVNLIAAGSIVGSDAKESIDAILAHGSVATRVALAAAIQQRHAEGFGEVMAALSEAPEIEVKKAAIRAMGEMHSIESLPVLIRMLEHEPCRAAVNTELKRFGEAGFEAAVAAFRSTDTSARVRRELPRALTQFERPTCAQILLSRLVEEPDGFIRYRIIRSLEQLVDQDPTIVLDAATLTRAIEDNVSRTYRYLDRRMILERGAVERPERATAGNKILARSLSDKVANGVERVFRLLGLLHPAENFGEILDAVRSKDDRRSASAIELLENVLVPPLRGAVVGLVDDVSDDDRLAAAGPFHRPQSRDYEALLERMLDSQSESVREMTAYHIGELKLERFRARLEALLANGGGADVELALSRLAKEVTHA
jgi:ATP:ADP antiporter, AAA family